MNKERVIGIYKDLVIFYINLIISTGVFSGFLLLINILNLEQNPIVGGFSLFTAVYVFLNLPRNWYI